MQRWLLSLLVQAALLSAQTRVFIMEWTMNIDMCSLEFLFNAGMDISSLNATKFILQQNETIGHDPSGNPYGGMYVRLSSNTTSYSLDGPAVSLTLGQQDCDKVKAAYTLADNRETSWLINEEGAMLDLSGNPLEALVDGGALQAQDFLDDFTPPYLKSFSLNMNSGVLLMEFSEVVDLRLLDTTKITLYNVQNATLNNVTDNPVEEVSYTLSATSVTPLVGTRANASYVPIELSFTDQNNLKRMKNLAVDNVTYIQFDATLVKDMVGFPIQAVTSDNRLQVKSLIPDQTGPSVTFFSLDTNAGVIRLNFDEAVDIATLDVTQLTICSSRRCAVTHTLSSACVSPSSSTYNIIIALDAADLTAINSNALLAKYTFNTWLSLTDSFIKDLAPEGNHMSSANKNKPIHNYNAFRVDKYIRYGLESYNLDINGTCHPSRPQDNVAPGPGSVLGEKTVDAVYGCESSTGYLRLKFTSYKNNENMDNTTLDVTKIRFMQEKVMQVESAEYYNGGEFYALTKESSYSLSYAGSEILVHIGKTDLDQIKLRSSMCVSQATTWIDLKSEVIQDMWGDGVTPQIDNDVLTPALQVTTFVNDYTRPSLVYYTLNIDTGKMDLYFSETMNVSSVNVSKLVVQAQRLQYMGLARRLSPETVNTMPNGNHLELVISREDLNALKVMRRLAITRSKTFLVVEDNAIKDMANNVLNPIPDGNAMLARAFVADGTQPVLTDNEFIDHTVTVTRWSMDMDRNVITLEFSEPVDSMTLKPWGITLYGDTPGTDGNGGGGNGAGKNATSFTLTNSSFAPKSRVADRWRDKGVNSVRLEIQLSKTDRNMIAIDPTLCVDQRSCWLKLANWTIQDMNGNQVMQIPEWNEDYALDPISKGGRNDPSLLQYLQCDSFTSDKTPPELLAFSLDIDAQLLTLNFSEAVDVSTLDVRGLTLMKESHVRNGLDGLAKFKIDWPDMYRFTGQPTPPRGGIGADGGDWIAGDIYCDIPDFTTRRWEAVQGALVTHKALFGTMYVPFQFEVPGQPPWTPEMWGMQLGIIVNCIRSQGAYLSEAYPERRAWLELAALDTTNGFDWDINYGDVQDAKAAQIDTVSTTVGDGMSLVMKVGEIDTNALKRRTAPVHHNHIGQALITERATTYLIAEPGAVKDMAGLPLVEIKDGALQGGAPLLASEPFTQDTKAPELEWFTFDIKTWRLLLHFTEAVNIDTFDPLGITLQEVSTGYITTTDLDHVRTIQPPPVVRITADQLATFFTSQGKFGINTESAIEDYLAELGPFDQNPQGWIDTLQALKTNNNDNCPEFTYRAQYFKLTDSKVKGAEKRCDELVGLEAQQMVRKPYMAAKYLCQVKLAGYTDGAGDAGHPQVLYQTGIDIEIELGPNDTAKLKSSPPLYTAVKYTAISMTNKTVQDFYGNYNVGLPNAPEMDARADYVTGGQQMKQPDCSACPSGFFLSKQCTNLDDRICTPCTICPYDHFANGECKPNHDTECRRCTVCPYEHYASKTCKGDSDSECRMCTKCGWNEFQQRPCQMGLDRVCLTCDSCTLTTLERENNQERKCRKSSLTWRQINCCWDSDNNQVKPCKDLGLQEFKISSRDGRRDEVWCTGKLNKHSEATMGGRFDTDKKQCLSQMGGKSNVPVPSYGREDTNRIYTDVNYNS